MNTFTSAGVGGSPVRSSDTRRMRVYLSASAEGFHPRCSNAARIKRSTALRLHFVSATFGNAARFGRTYAQCGSYSAPSATHCFNVAFCAADSFSFDSGGGIRSSASSVKIRYTNSLSTTSPGTIANAPPLRSFTASARTSSRSFALRAAASGPWHCKQFSERIARTSRLNPTFAGAARSEIAASKHPLKIALT